MPVIQTLSKNSFVDAFKDSSRKDQFTYEALEAIFEYLDEYSIETGEPVEFDPIAICCEWSEAPWEDIARDYSIDVSECDDEAACIEAVSDYLWENTVSVTQLSGGSFVFVQF